MALKREKWQEHKDYVDVKLSRIWVETKDASDAIQITIEKAKDRNNIYNITLDYFEKE